VSNHGDRPALRSQHVAVALGLWAAWYAAYRFYYAFGGQVGMIGRPASLAQFQRINLVGGVTILLAAVLPLVAARLWRHRPVRSLVAIAGWIIAVGCCAHALIDATGDVLSLTGVRPIQYPAAFWLSINRRDAALQDLFFNEPWFFIEGCLWALFAVLALRPSSRRRWRRSAVVGCALATVIGVLSGLGAIPTFRVG
jgi:hypothetical protein